MASLKAYLEKYVPMWQEKASGVQDGIQDGTSDVAYDLQMYPVYIILLIDIFKIQ